MIDTSDFPLLLKFLGYEDGQKASAFVGGSPKEMLIS
jgi:hypothetical protein